ncbi:MAG: HD domain-containing phosphohydrolase [Halanaerobiales bacterium]
MGTFLVIIIILITTLGFLTYNTTKTILINELKEESLKTMDNAYHYFIENYINENERILENLLTEIKSQDIKIDSTLSNSTGYLWEIVQKFNSNIWYVYIGTESGDIYVYPEWEPPEGYDPRVRPWYQSAIKKEGKISWSEPYQEYITNKMVVSSSITISESDRIIGVLSIDTSLEKVNNIINNMNFGENSYSILIDNNGYLISHPDSSMIGSNIRNESWYSELTFEEKGVHMTQLNGVDTFISYIIVPETGWKLLAFIPRESIDEVIKPLRNRAISIAIIGILITVIISYLISDWFTRKIGGLIRAMDEVENGNLLKIDNYIICKEFIDISEKFNIMIDRIKGTEDRLRHFSFYDTLTEVYNRNYFEEKILELENEHLENAGVMVFDVDGLKLINDSFGHDKGDQLLINIVNIIQECIPENSLLFRTGGDEFTLVLLETDKQELESIFKKVKNMAGDYQGFNNIPLSVSMGYSITSKEVDSISEAYLDADNHMYREKLHKSNSVRSTLVRTLMRALETRDYITEGHGERMQSLITSFAHDLGLSEQKTHDLCLYAQFHDIGKVGVPDKILFKEGPLTKEERLEMQKHTEMGYRIAMASPQLNHIAEWILKHHEWWNGQGYPLGLSGEDIPIESRILAIIDAYDAMTSDRPYREALSASKAVNELKKYAGIMFDPELVEKFIDILEEDES